MTIEKLMEITKSIDNNYQKFQLCKLGHKIYDMGNIVDVYNDSLSAVYDYATPNFTFNDRFFEEGEDGIYSWGSEDDIIEAYYYYNLIAEEINRQIEIEGCNTKEDIFYKLGIDI